MKISPQSLENIQFFMKQFVNIINVEKLTSEMFVHKALHSALYHVW